MNKRGYELNYGNLVPGKHEFKFHLDSDFFLESGASLVEGGNVDVLLDVEKTNKKLDLFFRLDGELTVKCDNCLAVLDYPIEGDSKVFVKFAEKSDFSDDEILYVSYDDYKLDLSELLYDFALLKLPMRKLCENSTNRDQCEALTKEILNRNASNSAVHPEMEKLKRLLNKEK